MWVYMSSDLRDGFLKMKVRYIGDYYKVYLEKGKVYDAKLIDGCWYEIYDKDDQESYLYSTESFEVVEGERND